MTFSPIQAPSFTQTPNIFVDDWLKELTFVQTKVLMVIMRKTFGWHKTRDRISLSQLRNLTGSNKTDISSATKFLEEKGLITKEVLGKEGDQETYYELVIIENSNNSYRYGTRTGGGTEPVPTKETLTKERKRAASAAPKRKAAPSAAAASSSSNIRYDWQDIIAGTGLKDEQLLELLKNFSDESIFKSINLYWIRTSQKRIGITYPWILKCLKEKWYEEVEKEKLDQDNLIKKNKKIACKVKYELVDKLKGGSVIEMGSNNIIFASGQYYKDIEFTNPLFAQEIKKELERIGEKVEF